MTTLIRKSETGEPTSNPGEFGTHDHSAPELMLPGFRASKRPRVATAVDHHTVGEIYGADLPPEVEPNALEVGIITLDGLPVHIARYEDDAGGYYQVWGDPIVAEVDMDERPKPISTKVLLREAANAYDQAVIARMRAGRGAVPSLDDLLGTEIVRLKARIASRG